MKIVWYSSHTSSPQFGKTETKERTSTLPLALYYSYKVTHPPASPYPILVSRVAYIPPSCQNGYYTSLNISLPSLPLFYPSSTMYPSFLSNTHRDRELAIYTQVCQMEMYNILLYNALSSLFVVWVLFRFF